MLNAGESERVLVVGGGIAGLATAAALQRQGIAVAVYERRPLPPDGGLGLNLPGNAIAALNTLGLACRLADLGAAVRRREYRSRRDRLLFAVDEDRYWGGRVGSRCVRRSDLHAALHDLLVPGTVRLGAHVRGVRAFDDGVKLTLSDGTRASGGALVGADGVHSVVRGLFARGHRVKAATLSPASWRFGTTNPGVGCWVAWTGGPGTVLLIPMGGDRLYGSVTCGDAATDFAETCAASRRSCATSWPRRQQPTKHRCARLSKRYARRRGPQAESSWSATRRTRPLRSGLRAPPSRSRTRWCWPTCCWTGEPGRERARSSSVAARPASSTSRR